MQSMAYAIIISKADVNMDIIKINIEMEKQYDSYI